MSVKKSASRHIVVLFSSFFCGILIAHAGSLANAAGDPSSAGAAAKNGYRCCMTDIQRYYDESPERIEKRFEIYKSIGVDMLRFEILSWENIEPQEGQWRNAPEKSNYLNLVKKYDFKIKLIAGTIMNPPAWYLAKNPDARMTNENGLVCHNTLNYWDMGIRPKLEEVIDKLFECYKEMHLLDQVELVVVDLGQAGEPLYPPAWTLVPDYPDYKGGETFWMYNRLAQQDFRDTMKEKYVSVEVANAVWGTGFKNWEDVKILKPGERPGAYWNDVLTRYRDRKRDFIIWQIDNFNRASKKYSNGRIKPLVYLAGSDYTDQMWADAVKTGRGDWQIKLMCDLRWLANTAVKKGCVLQYTGVENRPQVEYLVKYMKDNGIKYEMWGENAGEFSCAKDPLTLADIIISNGLYGLDFTHSHFMFKTKDSPKPAWEETASDSRADANGIEIHPQIGPDLKKAYQMIKEHALSEK
jgi:beta-galactosidase GanA